MFNMYYIISKEITDLEDEFLHRPAMTYTICNFKPISLTSRALCIVSRILMKTSLSTGIHHVYYSLYEVFWGISNLGYKTEIE